MNCPLCTQDSKRCFQCHKYWLRECRGCHHRFAEITPNPNHVAWVYDDHYFNGGDDGYPDYLSESGILMGIGRRYAQLVAQHCDAPGRMLDVGAAAGFILKGFIDSGWKGCGVEPNHTMAQFAQQELHLDVANCSFEEFETSEKFDLVSMIQVVSHFQEPLVAFEKAGQLTRPGGLLLIETWRRDSFTARFFGKNWHEYSPPTVLHWFTKASLSKLASKFGYEAIASGRPQKWISARHAKSLARYKLEQVPAGALLAKSLKMVPDEMNIHYPAEDLFWLLCRKTLL